MSTAHQDISNRHHPMTLTWRNQTWLPQTGKCRVQVCRAAKGPYMATPYHHFNMTQPKVRIQEVSLRGTAWLCPIRRGFRETTQRFSKTKIVVKIIWNKIIVALCISYHAIGPSYRHVLVLRPVRCTHCTLKFCRSFRWLGNYCIEYWEGRFHLN